MATVRHNVTLDWTLGENVRAQLRFDRPDTGKIAVMVINHYGDEVLKVFGVG